MNWFLNLNINTTNLPRTCEKFVNISIFFYSCGATEMLFQKLVHKVFKHSKTMKALGLRPRAFISFLVAAEKFYIFWCVSPIVVSSALLPRAHQNLVKDLDKMGKQIQRSYNNYCIYYDK